MRLLPDVVEVFRSVIPQHASPNAYLFKSKGRLSRKRETLGRHPRNQSNFQKTIRRECLAQSGEIA